MTYQPAEDTWLLLDYVKGLGRWRRGVEVGSGTGVVSEELSHHLDESIAVDLDWSSTEATKKRLKESENWSRCHVVCSDGLSAFRDGVFDLVISNPPYLEPEGLGDRAIEGGGGFVWRLFQEASRRLRRGGVMIVVASSLTKSLGRILSDASKLGFKVSVAARKRLFFEELMLIHAELR